MRRLAVFAAIFPLISACSLQVDTQNDENTDAVGSALDLTNREALPILKPFPRPFPLPNPEDFIEISAGAEHTCARKRNGNVYCWGRADQGQVGMGGTATCPNGPCVDRPKCVSAPGFTTAMQVEAGYNHTCALDPSGKAYCWGSASNGQLGIGSFGYQPAPIPVNGGLVYSSISAGMLSTCGTTSGGLYCWGAFMYGGGAAGSGAPSPVLLTTWNGYPVTGYSSVSVGYLHACAQYVIGSYRETNCWGKNHSGQAGSDPASFPIVPPLLATQLGTSVTRVSAEQEFTCADQPNGTVQCFGRNDYGQLGNGQSGYSASTHVPQTVAGSIAGLNRVSTGINHACALDGNGAAYCWGNGYWGQLGNNAPSPGPSSVPVAVAGGLTFRAIAAGRLHTCAIGTDNHIWCWGSNYSGQLGTQYPGGWVASPVQAKDP